MDFNFNEVKIRMDGELIAKQGNGLVEAAYSLSLSSQRVLAYTFAKAQEQKNYPDSTKRSFTLSATEFAAVFGLQKRAAYKALKIAAEEIMHSPLFVANIPVGSKPFDINHGFELFPISEGKKSTYDIHISWFKSCAYNEGLGLISYVLNDQLDKQVYEIVGGYTLTQLKYLKGLNRAHSMRFYTWFCRVMNLHKHQRNGGVEIEISVDWIIERLKLSKTYYKFDYMKRNLIEPAVKLINANTNLTVTYEKVYEGHYVMALKFFILDEKDKQHLPKPAIRPRLPRRPKVTAGSHEEGQWATKGIRLLTQYEIELSKEGKRLELKDIDRLIQYYQITGDTLRLKQYQSIALARRAK